MAPEYQRYLFDLIMAEGAEFDIRLFGGRALNALRLDKSYGSWSREYRPLYGPLEAGLGFAVALDKPAEFTGRAAIVKEKELGLTRRLLQFALEDPDALAFHDEPIYRDGALVGRLTSAGYGRGRTLWSPGSPAAWPAWPSSAR